MSDSIETKISRRQFLKSMAAVAGLVALSPTLTASEPRPPLPKNENQKSIELNEGNVSVILESEEDDEPRKDKNLIADAIFAINRDWQLKEGASNKATALDAWLSNPISKEFVGSKVLAHLIYEQSNSGKIARIPLITLEKNGNYTDLVLERFSDGSRKALEIDRPEETGDISLRVGLRDGVFVDTIEARRKNALTGHYSTIGLATISPKVLSSRHELGVFYPIIQPPFANSDTVILGYRNNNTLDPIIIFIDDGQKEIARIERDKNNEPYVLWKSWYWQIVLENQTEKNEVIQWLKNRSKEGIFYIKTDASEDIKWEISDSDLKTSR